MDKPTPEMDAQFEELLKLMDELIAKRERAAQAGIEPEDYYRHADMTDELCSVAELRYKALASEVQRKALWLS